MQYRAQATAYAQQYPDLSHDIIELDGRPVGRLMVDRQLGMITIIDISITPERRNMGIGTILLERLLVECSEKGLPCVLQVLVANPARGLYERLGFRVEGDDGVRFLMKWDS